MNAVAWGISLRAMAWPVSVPVERTILAWGSFPLRAATMGAAAVTSPTETAWTQIRGRPLSAETISSGMAPSFCQML